MDKIKRYLESSNYYNIYADPSLFENYIQNLTVDDVMKIVISLNQMLRNKEDEEVVSDNMIAGELTAPTSDIRNDIIQNLLDTLKEMNDNELRAELVYYTFINLHMFSDGNGRTARLLYGLITGKIENEEWYIHSDDSMHKYDGDFCSYREMLDESEVNYNSNKLLSPVIETYINKYPILLSKNMFRTYSTGTHGAALPIYEIISIEVSKQLTADEKSKIGIILEDNENFYSIAGLTMLIITAENGQLSEWIKRDSDNTEKCFQEGYGEDWMRNRLSFNLVKNKDLLLEWELEDWKKVIQIGNKLKLEQFNNMNEIYLNECNNKQMHENNLEVGHKRV